MNKYFNPNIRDIRFGIDVVDAFCKTMNIDSSRLLSSYGDWRFRIDQCKSEYGFLEPINDYLFCSEISNNFRYSSRIKTLTVESVSKNLIQNKFIPRYTYKETKMNYFGFYAFNWGRDESTDEFVVYDQFNDKWIRGAAPETIANMAAARVKNAAEFYGALTQTATKLRKIYDLQTESGQTVDPAEIMKKYGNMSAISEYLQKIIQNI